MSKEKIKKEKNNKETLSNPLLVPQEERLNLKVEI